jgi:2,4-dienoyl-CoA reductase-like NADH-dependent reductase (Old Yellow Enzyme family)/thioredoxin reductase
MNDSRFRELLKPGKIGSLEIPNRLVMPPMGTHYATEKGFVSNRIKAYYEARARGGVGLIIVEVTCIDSPAGLGIKGNLRLDDDACILGMKELSEVIHRHGSKAAVQLFHAGVSTHRRFTGVQPVGPSAIRAFTGDTSRELTREETVDLIRRFAEAAGRAKQAGFDGVEIHGATNYLVAQFLSRYWNQRTDDYGGSLKNRARFLLEILEASRAAVGTSYPLWFRINLTEFGLENGITLEEAKQIARWGAAAGSDAIHVSSFGAGSLAHMGPCVADHGILLPLTSELKKEIDVPVIGVGHIDPFQAEKALEDGQADFIAIGRGLLADPELFNKIREGRVEDVRPCICCLECIKHIIYKQKPLKCAVNPLCGKEEEYLIVPAEDKKNIIVIGGGPAGMEAARVAALRGHYVTLFEKESVLGGLLRSASRPPGKQDIGRLVDYLVTQIKKLGVEVQLGRETTPEQVENLKPDAVIVACGASPALPEIDGLRQAFPLQVEEVLLGKIETGKRVLIIGGMRNGCETAEFLSDARKAVTLVYGYDRLAPDVLPVFRTPLLSRLKEKKVSLYCGVKEGRIEGNRFIFKEGGKTEQTLKFDTVVVSGLRKPRKGEWQRLAGVVGNLFFIGDSLGARGILEAITDGNRAGRIV